MTTTSTAPTEATGPSASELSTLAPGDGDRARDAGDADTQVLRVLVVEDHELMREAIERRLDRAEDFRMIAGVGSVQEAAAVVGSRRPDVVLVDHGLPDGSGMDVLLSVKQELPSTTVVMLSATDDSELISSYLKAGVDGIAHKTVGASELFRVMRAAAAGQPALDPVTTQRVMEHLQHPPAPASPQDPSPLSRRETEVLSLVASGHTNDDIAARLFISPQTVKTHLSRIFSKLHVRDRASATATALREGMLD